MYWFAPVGDRRHTHTLTVKKANALLMSYVFLCACEACLAYMNVDMYVAAYMMQQACPARDYYFCFEKKEAAAFFGISQNLFQFCQTLLHNFDLMVTTTT